MGNGLDKVAKAHGKRSRQGCKGAWERSRSGYNGAWETVCTKLQRRMGNGLDRVSKAHGKRSEQGCAGAQETGWLRLRRRVGEQAGQGCTGAWQVNGDLLSLRPSAAVRPVPLFSKAQPEPRIDSGWRTALTCGSPTLHRMVSPNTDRHAPPLTKRRKKHWGPEC